MKMNPPEIVSAAETKLGELFDLRMQLVAASFAEAADRLSSGWWALWEIHCDQSWRTRYPVVDDWLGDLKAHQSVSRGDFYAMMNLIRNLKSLDVDETAIRKTLGKPMTALKTDLPKLMKDGRLTEEAETRINGEYGTPQIFVETVLNADGGTGRALVKQIVERDQIFFTSDPVYSEYAGEILCNLRWDNEGGLVGVYTLKISVTNITEGRQVRHPKYLPRTLAQWIMGRLGRKLG